MKKRIPHYLLILFVSLTFCLNAQKVLPVFRIKEISTGKILVSWLNPHKNCIKLSVQRSSNQETFQTLVWAHHPNLYENEFLDNKAASDSVFYYRIFYVLKGGKYYFSNTLNTSDHLESKSKKDRVKGNKNPSPASPNLLSKIDFKLSIHVFSNNKHNITVSLPEAKHHQYRLIFYEENGLEAFRMNQLKETEIYLDKSNFIHAGWFGFELYEDEKIMERNKILVQAN